MAIKKFVSKYEPMEGNTYLGESGDLWVDMDTNKVHIGLDAKNGGLEVVTNTNEAGITITDGADAAVSIQAGDNQWMFGSDGSVSAPKTLTLKATGGEYDSYVTVWDDGISDSSDVNATAVAYDKNGNAFISADYEYPGFKLAKLDPTGKVLWNKYFDSYGTYNTGMAVDKNGDVFLVGSQDYVISIFKVRGANGTVMWSKALTDMVYTNLDLVASVACDSQGNPILAGFFDNGDTGLEFAIIKFDGKDGTVAWSKRTKFDYSDSLAFSIAVDHEDNVAVVGNNYGMHPDWLHVAKYSKADGSLIWAKAVLDPRDGYGGGMDVGGISCDKDGNLYVSATWFVENEVYSTSVLTKLSKDGALLWAKSVGFAVPFVGAGHTTVDSDGNVYFANVYGQLATQEQSRGSVDPNYHYDRDVLLVIKCDANGKVIWQRFLARRQYGLEQNFGNIWMAISPGGKNLDVNDRYLLMAGITILHSSYDNSTEWYADSYMMQLPKDAVSFNHDGWEWTDSRLKLDWVSTHVYEPYDTQVDDLPIVTADLPVDIYDNVDQFSRSSLADMPSQKLVMDGTGIDMDRDTVGRWVTLGNFDGSEGGNTLDNTWWDGLVRDGAGNTFLFGGDDYNSAQYLTKVNAQGQVEWQSALENHVSSAMTAAVDPTTGNAVFVSLDGNEGFNVTYMDPNNGAVRDNIHVTGDQSGWYNPYGAAVDKAGRPVVVGENYWGHIQYTNLPAGTPQSGTDKIAIARSVFTNDEYPGGFADWQMVVDGSTYWVTDVNDWYNLASTTNSAQGTGSTWNVYIDPANPGAGYDVAIGDSAGTLYQNGDEIYVSGDLMLGDAVTNKLTITVTSVDGGGAVTGFNVSGTPQDTWVLVVTNGSGVDYSVNGPYVIQQDSGNDGFIWTPNWGRSIGGHNTNQDYFNSVDTNAARDVVAGGYFSSAQDDKTGIVVKLDKDGNTLWQVVIDQNDTGYEVNGVKFDPFGDVIVFATNYNGSVMVAKLDGTDGYFKWNVNIGDGDFWNEPYTGLDVDEHGFIYVGGAYYNGYLCYSDNFLVVKIDTNGGLVYMRDIQCPYDLYDDYGNGYPHNSISVRNGRMSLCLGYSYMPGDGHYQANMADLPADGSGRGNYGGWQYRELEYPYYINQGGIDHFSQAEIADHVFTVDNYDPLPPAVYFGMDSKITGDMKTATGGELKLSSVVFEDGSSMSTSGQDVPQVDQSKTAYSDYLVALEDRGKHIYKWAGSIYIPKNETVPFPIGSTITIVSDSNTIYLYADDNATTRIRGIGSDSTSSSYHIDPYSMVTLLKVQKDTWMLSGGVFAAN